MILDASTIINMGLGAEGRVIQGGDAQVTLIPNIIPTVQPIKPLNMIPGNGAVMKESFITRGTVNVTNVAGGSTSIIILDKGLWEIELFLSAWYNYVTVGGLLFGAAVEFLSQGFQFPAVTQFAVVGTQTNYARFRLMLQAQMTIVHSFGLTGAGQTINSNLIVNGIRII